MLKENLKQGIPVFGTMITTGCIDIAEIISYTGVDFIMIDYEHGSIGIETAGRMTSLIKGLQVTPFIRVACNLSIIIYGESGTGKEMFAQAIHNASKRKNYPFIAVNCAALSDSLLESELFGYEEGAFTGARKGGKPGYFELAYKGTIFLDEIGEINSNLQKKLLRVIEEREV